MKAKLYFETQNIPKTKLQNSTLPNIREGKIMQNNLEFRLDEDAELYEGYGTRGNVYPYTQQDNYTRELSVEPVKVAVLENDYLKAVFLPELGGRLWSLWDKEHNKNLLYTNDVIRFSNLASRNAWFSGGVEWNVGIIGHSPFTNEPLYCAMLEDEQGNPILRMYEYERIRQVCYQMDFWLREDSHALNCRMRITNETNQVLPMYWWSNIAVPEFDDGCILIPADKAFAYRKENDQGIVEYVDIPEIDGVNVCNYKNIQKQVDYFFDLHTDAPKYIANIDQDGFGLLHLSTNRLPSRKLFSWGSNDGSDNWQKFLTEKAGRYVEIQGGLAKTQYGCLPMAPHSAWEWMEQYGAIQLDATKDWHQKNQQATEIAAKQLQTEQLDQVLQQSKKTAKSKAKLVSKGNPYSGFLKEISIKTNRPQTSHLEFETNGTETEQWNNFMQTGVLHEPNPQQAPELYFCEQAILDKLQQTIHTTNKNNWYAQFHLGMMLFETDAQQAEEHFLQSWNLQQNAWAAYGLAIIAMKKGETQQAATWMEQGCNLRLDDLSYQKEGWDVLLKCNAAKSVLQLFEQVTPRLKEDKRLQYNVIKALDMEQQTEEAFARLNANEGLLPDDAREGDDELEQLWHQMHQKLHHTTGKIPAKLKMKSL